MKTMWVEVDNKMVFLQTVQKQRFTVWPWFLSVGQWQPGEI